MDHRDTHQRPARLRFRDMALDLGFRHAGVVLQRHGGDAAVGTAEAGKRRDGTDIVPLLAECRDLGADVEVLALDADGHGYPPVIGGKNAISRAPAICVSGFTCILSMAARITFAFSNA